MPGQGMCNLVREDNGQSRLILTDWQDPFKDTDFASGEAECILVRAAQQFELPRIVGAF